MSSHNNLRIVLLDDDDTIRETLTEVLVHRGYEVFSFSDPDICPLKKLPECRCSETQTCTDIIISDLDMPNVTGLDFIENQRHKGCRCRYIALMSGKWTNDELKLAHELDCKTFLKPFPFEELFDWLDEIEKNIEPSRELTTWIHQVD